MDRRINRILASAVALILWPLLSPLELAAQEDEKKFELFGGYSYLRVNTDLEGATFHGNGWIVSFTVPLNRWLGLTTEASGHYGSIDLPVFCDDPSLQLCIDLQEIGLNANQHTFLFGPQFRIFDNGKLRIQARALLGATRVGLDLPLSFTVDDETFNLDIDLAQYGVAAAFGASVDWKINDSWAWRLVQPELVLINLGGATTDQLRVSTGVVFSF